MKNYRVISLVLILLCSSCNDTSFSSSSSISNIPEVLLGKYPNMRIEIPDGIYRVESRLNSYVYEYGNYYLCSLKSVSYIDLTERNVKRLDQSYEGILKNDDYVCYCSGSNYFDGQTKYEKYHEFNKDIYNNSTDSLKTYYKNNMDKMKFYGPHDYYFFLLKRYLVPFIEPVISTIYSYVRILFDSYGLRYEDNKLKEYDSHYSGQEEIRSKIYKTIYLDADFDYKKEEIEFYTPYYDAIFTFEKIDNHSFKEVEDKNLYVETDTVREYVQLV